MFAPKLKPGDGVRVIAPSSSLTSSPITPTVKRTAEQRLAELGLRLSFGEHAAERDAFDSSSIEYRIADLHAAFADRTVQLVLPARGGFNSNQLLRHIDYDLIRRNPKILCGFSDITALATAIHARTELVTYSGPNFSSFGQPPAYEYTENHFRRCLFSDEPFPIEASTGYALEKKSPLLEENFGFLVLQSGRATGRLLGGNLATLCHLNGTEYFPDLTDAILFLEDDSEAKPRHFDNKLQALIHQPGFDGVRGLAIGRFEKESTMTDPLLRQIVATKPELTDLPVIANVDFGHTLPMITFPIGGTVEIDATGEKASIRILEH